MLKLATATPLGVYRTSGSLPRRPIKITLLIPAIISSFVEHQIIWISDTGNQLQSQSNFLVIFICRSLVVDLSTPFMSHRLMNGASRFILDWVHLTAKDLYQNLPGLGLTKI
jgi:hypothetical protein